MPGSVDILEMVIHTNRSVGSLCSTRIFLAGKSGAKGTCGRVVASIARNPVMPAFVAVRAEI